MGCRCQRLRMACAPHALSFCRSQVNSGVFEQLIVHSSGVVETRVVRGWQLAFDYRSFRSTQFVRSSEWEVLPLDLSGVAGFFPVLLLLFPVGMLIGGIVLLRRSRFGAPAV